MLCVVTDTGRSPMVGRGMLKLIACGSELILPQTLWCGITHSNRERAVIVTLLLILDRLFIKNCVRTFDGVACKV